MTRDEFKVLVKAMKAVYTNPSFIPDQYAFDVWYEMLKDLDYKIADYAVKQYMQSEEREPKVSSIRKHAASFISSSNCELNEMEAWALVRKAIGNSAYNFDLEFSKLPPLVQKCVGLPKQLYVWATDENYNEEVVSSNFIKCYRSESLKEKKLSSLSSSLKRIANNAPVNPYSAHISTLRENSIKYLDDKEKSEIDGFKLYTHGVPMPNKAKERLNEIFKTE